jgi:glucose-6-phosphate 1-dehydrogenase
LEAKVPDQDMTLKPVDMEFHYDSAFKGQEIPEAYQRLLQDALDGDARLFIRNDHIEEAWRIVDPLLEGWEDPSAPPLHPYRPGTWGPDASDALLAQDGNRWLHLCGGG